MNPLLMTGIGIVVTALASYTTTIVTQTRHRTFRRPSHISRNPGLLRLLLMATDLVLMWRRYRAFGVQLLPARLHRYFLAAYSWWVSAFLAGIVVALRIR